jgi:predicted PurR-regulated permease PerM
MNASDNADLPRWSNTTKLIVTITIVIIVGLLLWKFQFILGPLLFAIILSYLVHPVAGILHKNVHLPWRVAVTILYLLLFLILFGLITWGGLSLVEPLENFVIFLQKLIKDLPGSIASVSSQVLVIGPFSLNLTNLNLTQLWSYLQGIVSPILSSVGSLLAGVATGAVSTVVWTVFTLLVSYFFCVETSGTRANLIHLDIPRYQIDFELMKAHLSRIWGAFLRGQLTVFVITYIIYSIVLASFGVKYFFALAILAGLARFVPYVGPFVAWTTYGLVAYFQGSTILSLQPLPYALIIVGSAILIDAIIDNFVTPRVMSNALSVHPAAVLVTVIVAAKLIGFLGVLLAAPVLASLKLFFHYALKKLMDLDPWEDLDVPAPSPPLRKSLIRLIRKIKLIWIHLMVSLKRGNKKSVQNTRSQDN